MTALKNIAISLAVLIIGQAAAQAAPCTAKDFTVKNIRSRPEYGKTILTATVSNNSNTACGVQIKASSYDKNGAVVDTNDFWPASVRNIAPGAAENFKTYIRMDKDAKTYELTPIDIRVW